MTVMEAGKILKESSLTCKSVGSGDIITGQIPTAGQSVPGGSEVLLYLGEEPENETVEVPDFLGMNRQQASDTAGILGIYVLVAGNDGIDPAVKVVKQNISAGTAVDKGTVVELIFTDTRASD